MFRAGPPRGNFSKNRFPTGTAQPAVSGSRLAHAAKYGLHARVKGVGLVDEVDTDSRYLVTARPCRLVATLPLRALSAPFQSGARNPQIVGPPAHTHSYCRQTFRHHFARNSTGKTCIVRKDWTGASLRQAGFTSNKHSIQGGPTEKNYDNPQFLFPGSLFPEQWTTLLPSLSPPRRPLHLQETHG